MYVIYCTQTEYDLYIKSLLSSHSPLQDKVRTLHFRSQKKKKKSDRISQQLLCIYIKGQMWYLYAAEITLK